MKINPWKFVPGFALIASMLILTGLCAAQTPAPASHPKTQKKTPASASKPAGHGLTARGAQREASFTPDDKISFEKETRVAIIVAPSYRDSGLATLRFTFADAVELKAELERQGYTVRMIPSTEATADAIRQTLTNQKTFLDGTKQATLLFAFMGHGFQDSQGKNYLMTYGADLSNMQKEALPVDEVEALIAASGARRKVILIDACRNVAGTRDAEKPRTMADFQTAEGMAMLLATRPGAYSYEDPELSHGVFTYYVLEGLRGKAATKDGYVTFDSLSKYVEKEVSDYAIKKDEAQRPRATLKDVGGDFLLATAAPPKPEDVKPSPVASQITSDAVLMKSTDGTHSYFTMVDEHTLTLVDATTGQPTILGEHSEQLKDKKEMSKGTYRWFAGDRPDSTVVQMVAEMNGNELLRLWGRVGKPCPNDQPCATTPYPLLPGEMRDSKSNAVDKASKISGGWIRSRISPKTDKSTAKVESAAVVAKSSGIAADSRDKFIWTKFDLANTAKLAKAAPAPAKP